MLLSIRSATRCAAAVVAASAFAAAPPAAADARPDTSEGWPYVEPPPPPPTPEEIAERERRDAERAAEWERQAEERRRNPPPAPDPSPAPAYEPPPKTQVDVELLLLVDSSGSVDDREWQLQIDGYVEAFEDPSVQAQITRSDGVVVNFMTWSSTWQHTLFGWRELRTRQDCLDYAAEIRTYRRFHRDNTVLSNALGVGIWHLGNNRWEGRRRVIDVSGDGVCENQAYYAENAVGDDPELDRLLGPTWEHIQNARPADVTINGISIGDVEGLDRWYAQQLPRGNGSFTMHAQSFEAFAGGIREKLIRELAPTAYD